MEDTLKNNLRKNMLIVRKNMPDQNVSAFSLKIMDTIISLPQFINCKNIMLYMSFNNEVDTYKLATWCLNNNKTVIAPYCIKSSHTIVPFIINNLTNDLSKSTFGIMEPKYDI